MTNGSDGPPPGIAFTAVSKPGGGVRWLAELDPGTERRYRDAVGPAVARIERMLDPGVVGNRAGPGGRLRPLGPAHDRWNRCLARLARGSGALLRSDVEACYPSICADIVGRALARSGVRSHQAREIMGVLEDLERAGLRGLPIGPEPSAILANVVLAEADGAARQAGARIVRWVDDVVLAGPDRRTVVRSFDAWARTLASMGLRPHDGKTSLTGGGAPHGGSDDPAFARLERRGMMPAP